MADGHFVTSTTRQRLLIWVKIPGLVELERVYARITTHAETGKVTTVKLEILRFTTKLCVRALYKPTVCGALEVKIRVLSEIFDQTDVCSIEVKITCIALEHVMSILFVDFKQSGIIRNVGNSSIIRRGIKCNKFVF